MLDGLARSLVSGYSAGVEAMHRAVRAFRDGDVTVDEELRWLWEAGAMAMLLWDDESFDVLTSRHISLGRQTGALARLPIAYSARIVAHAYAGNLDAADEVISELKAMTDAIGSPFPPYGPLIVAAWRGREPEAARLIELFLHDVEARGEGAAVATAYYTRAVLYNALGRYSEALTAATGCQDTQAEGFTISNMALSELAEAAIRSGNEVQAREATDRLSDMALASGTNWALGLSARLQGMLASGDAAEALYLESIERLGRTRIKVQLARSHLVYGEWLRHVGRRLDARCQLRMAHEMLTTMGIAGFAARARLELLATGESVPRRSPDTVDQLTAQEAHIARLAREGQTNTEIGAQLFISAADGRVAPPQSLRQVGHRFPARTPETLSSAERPDICLDITTTLRQSPTSSHAEGIDEIVEHLPILHRHGLPARTQTDREDGPIRIDGHNRLPRTTLPSPDDRMVLVELAFYLVQLL